MKWSDYPRLFDGGSCFQDWWAYISPDYPPQRPRRFRCLYVSEAFAATLGWILDIKALRDWYESDASRQSTINLAKATLERLRYKNERTFSFEHFSAKLQRIYDDLEECGRNWSLEMDNSICYSLLLALGNWNIYISNQLYSIWIAFISYNIESNFFNVVVVNIVGVLKFQSFCLVLTGRIILFLARWVSVFHPTHQQVLNLIECHMLFLRWRYVLQFF